jgi:hypothetical protein
MLTMPISVELAVHLGIVDDFAEQKDFVVGEDAARGVGEVDGALDAVAEAESRARRIGRVADLRQTLPPGRAMPSTRGLR